MKYSVRIIVLITMLALALSGCRSSSSGAPTTTEPGEFALEETSPNLVDQNAISYVGVDGFFVPLSWVVEGHQLLSGDIGPVSVASENLLREAPPAEGLTQIEAPEESALGPSASNGTWNFFPDAAQYHTYEPDSQPNQQEWTDYFEEKLAALGYDGPILIRQSVRFQGASSEVAVVTASNITTNGVQAFLEGASICQTESPQTKCRVCIYLQHCSSRDKSRWMCITNMRRFLHLWGQIIFRGTGIPALCRRFPPFNLTMRGL